MPIPESVEVIETSRLKLEKVGLKHLSQEYVNWLNDPEVTLYLETSGGYDLDMLKDYLNKAEANEKLNFWAIIRKDTGQHIGNIKIDPINQRHGRGEYGILLGHKPSWGQGFAGEATKAILTYGFNTLNLRKITLGVVADNEAAVALYKKLGFVIEGHQKKHGYYNGKLCDTFRMALFSDSH